MATMAASCPDYIQLKEAESLLDCARTALADAKSDALHALRICPLPKQRDALVTKSLNRLRESGRLLDASNRVLGGVSTKCGILRPRSDCYSGCACGVDSVQLESGFEEADSLLDQAQQVLCHLGQVNDPSTCLELISKYSDVASSYQKAIESFVYLFAMFRRPPFRPADAPICCN